MTRHIRPFACWPLPRAADQYRQGRTWTRSPVIVAAEPRNRGTKPQERNSGKKRGYRGNNRGNIQVDGNFQTNQKGVFAAGDCQRGQSLIVWAIAEGRKAARATDIYLMGRSELA